METRANYVLIGAFALAGFLGILAFFLWFARVELDRQFAYYDILFPSVSGLDNASEVRFAGFPVGQVVDVRLALDGTGRIRVRIEVAAETPVRTGTVATIESQGVTGVSYVGLSRGGPEEPLLRAAADEEVPVITAGRSVLQSLSEDAPQVIDEVLSVARQLREILGEENQGRIARILANLETSSGDLGQVLDDFATVTSTVATASEEIAAFTSRLEAISAAATTALETADGTLQEVTELAKRAEATLEVGDAALESGRRALDTAQAFIAEDLPNAIAELNASATGLREQVDLVGTDARAMLGEFRQTGALASARLTEAEATLARMTEALAAFDSASESFQAFVEGDGTALVADARTLMADANRVIASATTVAEEDLPAIVEDIRAATATAARVVEEVGADLSSAAGRVDGLSADASAALATVSDTFARANETLAGLDRALETGEGALKAAEGAFTSADRVLTEEVDAIAADLRRTLGRLDEAMAQVSGDLPQITEDLRATAASASAAFARFEQAIADAAPPVRDFAREGLPQYTRLARETRNLIAGLEALIRRLERDPARYFFGQSTPEFRR